MSKLPNPPNPMHNTWLIAKREYFERIRTKAFLVATILIPLLMGSFVFGADYLSSRTKSSAHIAIVSADPQFATDLKSELQNGKLSHMTVDLDTPSPSVRAALDADLKKRNRSDWVSEEMEVLTSPKTYDFHPERAWERLKTRVRKPKELAVLMEVAAWREQEAQSRDVPRSRVLKDDAVGDIATHAPTTFFSVFEARLTPVSTASSNQARTDLASAPMGAGGRRRAGGNTVSTPLAVSPCAPGSPSVPGPAGSVIGHRRRAGAFSAACLAPSSR